MKCFVTGASGFIGSNLVRELLARGHRVKALLRPGAAERGLLGQQFERVTGDLLDRRLLEREMAGCDWCFHVAAAYQLWMRDYAPMYAANVEGTRNVLEAAGVAGCRKIIYTSTVGCIGLPEEVDGKVIPANESAVISDGQLMGDYKRSKFQAETVAMDLFHKNGLPVIIVNPSAPVGPGDVKPTPTGQIIVDFLNRRLPAFLDTGLNWVHVRDVAVGHILAAEKGSLATANFRQPARQLDDATNTRHAGKNHRPARSAKSRCLTGWPCVSRKLSEGIAFFTGKAPQATLAGVRMARHKMWFDSGQGHPRTRPAPDSARTSLRRCRRLVPRQRVCEEQVNSKQGLPRAGDSGVPLCYSGKNLCRVRWFHQLRRQWKVGLILMSAGVPTFLCLVDGMPAVWRPVCFGTGWPLLFDVAVSATMPAGNSFGAGGRTRTDTTFYGPRILSPVRLPFRHTGVTPLSQKSRTGASSRFGPPI